MSNLREKLKSIHLFDVKGFRKVKDIGHGDYSLVTLVEKDGQQIVFKYFEPRNDNINIEKYVAREIICMDRCKRADNKYVIGFLGISFTDIDGSPLEYPLIVENYAKHGSLLNLLNRSATNPNAFPLVRKMFTIYEIAKGMDWLHHNQIVHRDLKPENILLDENDNPLIADFGCCRPIEEDDEDDEEEKKGTQLGTPLYEAPEVFDDDVQSESMDKTDVFSYGMVMYTILTGKKPYEGFLKRANFNTIPDYLKKNERRFDLPKEIPSYFEQLLYLLWNQNPDQRPSFHDVISIYNAGITMPQILMNEEDKNEYFRLISASSNISSKKLTNLQKKIEVKNNNPQLSSVILLFLADYMNDPEAQTRIGCRYTDGEILQLNQNLGFKYFQKAAEKNNGEALFRLGKAYKYGIGTNPNEKLSNDMFQKSSETGYQIAQRYLTMQSENKNIDTIHCPTLVILGSWVTGKTTFINKMIDMYNNSKPLPTISTSYVGMYCENDQGERFYVKIRDTQGMERYGALAKESFRGANLAIIMFDINNRESFESLDRWIGNLREANGNAKLIIIGNKIDLERHVSRIEAREKANGYEACYYEISALYGESLDGPYQKIVQILQHCRLPNQIETVNLVDQNNEGSGFFGFFRNHC